MLPANSARPYGIIVTGVGGTGIVTVGAIIGMAAHLEGKGAGVLDMAGLAQKGGAVLRATCASPRDPEDIHAIRVAARGADLVLRRRHRGRRQQEGARGGQARPHRAW